MDWVRIFKMRSTVLIITVFMSAATTSLETTTTLQTTTPQLSATTSLETPMASETTSPQFSATTTVETTMASGTTSPHLSATTTLETSTALETTSPQLSATTTLETSTALETTSPQLFPSSTPETTMDSGTTSPQLSSTTTPEKNTASETTTPQLSASTTLETTTASVTTSPQLSTTSTIETTTASPPPTTTIITTQTTTTTTTMPTTTVPILTPDPTIPLPKVAIAFVLTVLYEPDLGNHQSNTFKRLAAVVKKGCDTIYKNKFGPHFLWTIVIAFRQVVRTRMTGNVETELELVFDGSSADPIPGSSEIVETLKEAASNQASGLNLSIDIASIAVIRALQTIPVTILTNGTFVAALSNSSSPEYRNRTSMIKTGLEPFFIADYPTSFIVLSLTNISDASVKSISEATIRNTMDLTFAANSTLPNSTQIVNTIVRAANNNTLPFKIFTYSIVINGTAYSSGEASSQTSMLTASLLVVLSLLVTRFD
ncbi:uncharacterized protein [Misgurnus anguillicaudatus]|uniref:uncharacterized protein n=1 Tax=Misgurnus anguillicaudatus TaxID=75329 RepID=UPI003CCFAF47